MSEPQACEWQSLPSKGAARFLGFVVREPDGSYEPRAKPRLLEQVRAAIRTRHYSDRTEKAYLHWIKRFIFFHEKRHPVEMGEAEIGEFLPAWPPKLMSGYDYIRT